MPHRSSSKWHTASMFWDCSNPSLKAVTVPVSFALIVVENGVEWSLSFDWSPAMGGGWAEASQHEILSGWKEIAAYLGIGVRTAQRYESQLALPIRRPAGKPRMSVLATRAELDAWVVAMPIRDAGLVVKAPAPVHLRWAEIEQNFAEMLRQCAQLKALRSELESTVDHVRQTARILRRDHVTDRWSSNHAQNPDKDLIH